LRFFTFLHFFTFLRFFLLRVAGRRVCYNKAMSSPLVIRRLVPACLLLLLLPPLLAGCGKSLTTAKVQDTLAEALRRAQVDPDDKGARRYVDSAIALAPNDPATYFGDPGGAVPEIGVAAVFEAVGDDPALIDYMTQAVQKFPDDYRGGQLLVDALGRQGRTAEKRAAAANLVALLTKKLQAPGVANIPTLTASLARAYFDAGDAANGAAQYKKVISAYPALSSYPNDLGPYNGLAYGYAEANTHLPEALGLAQKALALVQQSSSNTKDEEIPAVQDTLGWVQHRMGDDKNAEQNLLEAVGTDPREPELRFHLGTVYAAEGKTDAARAEFGHAVLLCPGYAAAQQALDGLPKPSASS